MRVKLILFVIVLSFLAGCTYEQPINNDPGPSIFIIDENNIEPQIKTFVVVEDSPLAWFEETKHQRYRQNLRRNIEEYHDDQEEIALRQRFANVRRIIEDDSGETKLIIGYDKELDNPDFKEVDSDSDY